MTLPSHFELNDGNKIPALGFGTWQAAPHEVEQAVEIALKCGYRHIDCAAIYRNETEVGEGMRKSGVPRKDIFITSKLWNTMHAPEHVEEALNKTLRDLGTDYVDLYLMHWPLAFKYGPKWFPLDSNGIFQLEDIDPLTTWKAMEQLLSTGKVRSIGVSNFNIPKLQKLLAGASIVPAVNQIEAHPYLQQPTLTQFCKDKNILIEAYSPLGNNQTGEPRTVDDQLVKDMASKLGIDGGLLLASWGIQRGTVVLPKSVTPHRIESNGKVVELPEYVFAALNGLERHKRFNYIARWGFDMFDEVGEAEAKKSAIESGPENLVKFTV